MLSEDLARSLSAMPYRADAERRISYLPLASIYWTDELSERVDDLFEDGNEKRLAPLLRLFAIRGALWTGTELNRADRVFWDEARAQAPEYALFHRLEVSEDEVAMYRDVASTARSFWQDFFRLEDEPDQAGELVAAEDVEVLSEMDIVQEPLAVE